MAFVPFVESDQPTMSAFNEKFQQNFAAALAAGTSIVTGSYTGTGTSGGNEAKVRITLPKKPAALIVYQPAYGFLRAQYAIGFVWGDTAVEMQDYTGAFRNVTLSYPNEKTVEWYADVGSGYGGSQLNGRGATYRYIAFVQKEE